MKFSIINEKLKNLFGIDEQYGEFLYNHIVSNQICSILEIGFAHGKSTCYMAGALDELNKGRIITIDLQSAFKKTPNIIQLSESLGLEKFIKPIFSEVSSNWELRKLIIEQTEQGFCKPIFDFCFIDAFHSWEMASLDFFLSNKLLKPGGWIVFDDLNWSFSKSPSWQSLEKTRKMPEDFRNANQVGEVFDFIVRQCSDFENFKTENSFGVAQKKND